MTKWISVKEGLPEFEKLALVYNDGICDIARYCNHSQVNALNAWYTNEGCEFIPTHWMPLPEPPENES